MTARGATPDIVFVGFLFFMGREGFYGLNV